jgi:molecular chaperone DnaK
MARDNWSLGQFEIEFDPAPKGAARVGVQFEIDVNGILHVLARDTKTGQEKTVEINSAIDVSDEAVEAMIAESFDHAFEDMNERVWIETELKAKEMLNAVAIAFERVGDEIDPAEKETILQAVAQVKKS